MDGDSPNKIFPAAIVSTYHAFFLQVTARTLDVVYTPVDATVTAIRNYQVPRLTQMRSIRRLWEMTGLHGSTI